MTQGQVMSPLFEVVNNLKFELEKKRELNAMMVAKLSRLSYIPDSIKKEMELCNNTHQDGELLPSTIQTDLNDIHFELTQQNSLQRAILDLIGEIIEGCVPFDPSMKVGGNHE